MWYGELVLAEASPIITVCEADKSLGVSRVTQTEGGTLEKIQSLKLFPDLVAHKNREELQDPANSLTTMFSKGFLVTWVSPSILAPVQLSVHQRSPGIRLIRGQVSGISM